MRRTKCRPPSITYKVVSTDKEVRATRVLPPTASYAVLPKQRAFNFTHELDKTD